MKSLKFCSIAFTLLILPSIVLAQKIEQSQLNKTSLKTAALFEENKGQMKDQYWKARPDILFYGNQEGMNYFIRDNGVSYQLSRVESWKDQEIKPKVDELSKKKVPDQISTYRVDANWLGCNTDFTIEKGNALDGYNNYYNVPDGVEPALFVKQYENIKLKNVWDGIDIHYYGTNGFLETDYLVAPGADYHQIKLEFKGAELSISDDGNLNIKTPFGEIREGSLKVFQGNELLHSKWKILDSNYVTFDIPNHNNKLALRIDPLTRVWATYYGGNYEDYGISVATDISNNVYLGGYTGSSTNIASGGFQNSWAGYFDAFFVKFNSNGMRIYGTYYGGSNSDEGHSISTDISGNVYLAGYTGSLSNIAFNGYQNSFGGGPTFGTDAFLVKFNGNGLRQWSTYYGGTENDYGYSVATDFLGNVYLGGSTLSSNNIAFSGHQNSYGGGSGSYGDAFLVKFSSLGLRQWGTYYGGTELELSYSIAVDISGDIYLSGSTHSSNNIAFSGHQNSYGGGNTNGDAFLVKFDSSGVRLWGTYYGGTNDDYGYATSTDLSGDVYLTGYTNSTSSIAIGGYQNTYGGGQGNSGDAFLVKFTSNGARKWGTYYGDVGGDYGYSITTDISSNVYLGGYTGSPANIASGGFQNTYFGAGDALLVKFDSSGNRIWATYYGGSMDDRGLAISADQIGNVFLGGRTRSNSNIAASGYQNTISGNIYYDTFLVKFSDSLQSTFVEEEEFLAQNLMLYPNPFVKGINIEFDDQVLILNIKIVDEFGRLVFQVSPKQMMKSYTIDIESLAEGIYTLQISTEKGKINKKVVKSKG
jgi:hypothetical protein